MTAKELKSIRAKLGFTQKRLADMIGIAPNNLAKQERGELGISEPVARLVRLIAAGVNVEAITDTGSSGRDPAPKSAKSPKPGNTQSPRRRRAR
jgi:transcriptional regulator with XRE-family HTH domain